MHTGFEFLYILEGELEIRHADKTHIVETGDGVYFDASTPHSYRCSGRTATQVIIVTMHHQQVQHAQNTVRPLNVVRSAPGVSLGAGGGLSMKQAAATQPVLQAPRTNGSSAAL